MLWVTIIWIQRCNYITWSPGQDPVPPFAFWGSSLLHNICMCWWHFITFFHSKDEFESHRRSINPLAANVVTEAKGDFAIRHQRGARWSPGKFPAGDILHMEQRQDSLLLAAIRHDFFPECFPSFQCSSVKSRACQGWAPLDYCAKTQTGHCSQVKLELEESIYTLKTGPLFSLAGAANKTSLLLLCSALWVPSLPLFKGLKMLLTLLFKQSLQSSREFWEREKRKDERQENFLD